MFLGGPAENRCPVTRVLTCSVPGGIRLRNGRCLGVSGAGRSPATGPRALMLGGGEQPVLGVCGRSRGGRRQQLGCWCGGGAARGARRRCPLPLCSLRRCARRGWCLRRVIRWLAPPSVVPRRPRPARCLLVSSGPLGRAQVEDVAEARREPSPAVRGLGVAQRSSGSSSAGRRARRRRPARPLVRR